MSSASPSHPYPVVDKPTLSHCSFGQQSTLYTLQLPTPSHLRLELLDWGCRIHSLQTLDKHGQLGETVLGFDGIQQWVEHGNNFNSLVGRCANRIANGRFLLNDSIVQLECNERGVNHLHGGTNSFHSRLFTLHSTQITDSSVSITLQLISPHQDNNYPGQVTLRARFTLHTSGALVTDFEATSNADTIVNLTHHTYWNLNQQAVPLSVKDHELRLHSKQVAEVDENLIPTGLLYDVSDASHSHFDFRRLKTIGRDIDCNTTPSALNRGYDHCYIIDKQRFAGGPRVQVFDAGQSYVATLMSLESGRCMHVYSTAPAVQLYTANHFDGTVKDRNGQRLDKLAAVCLELQLPPNAINIAHFPQPLLRKGESFKQTTTYVFTCAPRTQDIN